MLTSIFLIMCLLVFLGSNKFLGYLIAVILGYAYPWTTFFAVVSFMALYYGFLQLKKRFNPFK